MIYEFVKDVLSDKLLFEIANAGLPSPTRIDTVGTNIYIVYESPLSVENQGILSQVVTNHVKVTTVEGLTLYLEQQVFPFIKDLINEFAAQNIAMGITQAGKTADVLGLFEKQVNIGSLHLVSLKAAFDTGSLYVAIEILQYFRDNYVEYANLSPYITDERLLGMKNKIETFLGIQLSL